MADRQYYVRLTDEQIAALEALAEQTGSRAMRGPTRMAASWRVLIGRIADNEFHLQSACLTKSARP